MPSVSHRDDQRSLNDAGRPAAELPSTWPRRPLVLVLAGALLLGWLAALMLMAWREGQ